MNKTVTANIGGFVFNVEEQAYETLNAYLRAVRKSLGTDESADEIMSDVEMRMAELLKDILFKEKREVIGITDVNYIMEVMGAPEVYASDDAKADDKTEESKSSENKSGSEKQIFRDPDDRKLGGVCSGLAAYFGWDPVFLRILFVILFFLGGGGFLIYIILWIIIPEAKTTADKMKMRGEKINVEGIKNKFKDFKKDVEDLASPERKKKYKDGANQVAGYFERTIRSIGEVVGKAMGFILIVVSIVFLMIFIRSLFTSEFLFSITENGTQSFNYDEFGEVFFGSTGKSTLVFVSVLVFLILPLAAVILWGVRLVFNTKFKSKPLNITMGILCGAATITLVVIGLQTGIDFSKEKQVNTNFPVTDYNGDTIYVEVSHDPFFSDHYENERESFPELVLIDDKKIIYGYPQLNISRSNGKGFNVMITKTAHGSSQREAIERMEGIQYHMNQKDSLLVFDPFFSTPKSDLIRRQQVEITLQIPEGKVVYLGKGTRRIIYDIQNNYDVHDRDMEGHYWIMKETGLQETWR